MTFAEPRLRTAHKKLRHHQRLSSPAMRRSGISALEIRRELNRRFGRNVRLLSLIRTLHYPESAGSSDLIAEIREVLNAPRRKKKSWQAREAVMISDDMRKNLKLELARTDIAVSILSKALPTASTPPSEKTVHGWLCGREDKVDRKIWRNVMGWLERQPVDGPFSKSNYRPRRKTPSPQLGYVQLEPHHLAEIERLRQATGLPFQHLSDRPDAPVSMPHVQISKWLSGQAKYADGALLQWVLETYQSHLSKSC